MATKSVSFDEAVEAVASGLATSSSGCGQAAATTAAAEAAPVRRWHRLQSLAAITTAECSGAARAGETCSASAERVEAGETLSDKEEKEELEVPLPQRTMSWRDISSARALIASAQHWLAAVDHQMLLISQVSDEVFPELAWTAARVSVIAADPSFKII